MIHKESADVIFKVKKIKLNREKSGKIHFFSDFLKSDNLHFIPLMQVHSTQKLDQK